MTRIFWNLYSLVYDSIALTLPYGQLMADMLEQAEVRAGAEVLDAGCGTGNLLRQLQERHPGVRATGVDAAEGMLARAARRCPRAHLRRADLDGALPFAEGSFDLALSCNVLYSLPRPLHTLGELCRVLRPGGRLVLATPRQGADQFALFREHLRSGRGLRHWLGAALLLIPLSAVVVFNLLLLRRQGQRPGHFFDEAGLRHLLEQAGFTEIEIGLTYAGQDWLARARKPARVGDRL